MFDKIYNGADANICMKVAKTGSENIHPSMKLLDPLHSMQARRVDTRAPRSKAPETRNLLSDRRQCKPPVQPALKTFFIKKVLLF